MHTRRLFVTHRLVVAYLLLYLLLPRMN